MARRVLPSHVGFIPDGNHRWAAGQGLPKQSGYQAGIGPGLALYEHCRRLGIPEVSVYGLTRDNTKRPPVQIEALLGLRGLCPRDRPPRRGPARRRRREITAVPG